jgi:cytochrome c556
MAEASPEEQAAAVEARQNHMKSYGGAMRVLGQMARGDAAYDAAAATEAANTLAELSAMDILPWFVEGTAVGYPESEALPAIWENGEDFRAKHAALNAAAVAMQAAAGTDLAALQAAMGPLGAACGSCHELYRQPSN